MREKHTWQGRQQPHAGRKTYNIFVLGAKHNTDQQQYFSAAGHILSCPLPADIHDSRTTLHASFTLPISPPPPPPSCLCTQMLHSELEAGKVVEEVIVSRKGMCILRQRWGKVKVTVIVVPDWGHTWSYFGLLSEIKTTVIWTITNYNELTFTVNSETYPCSTMSITKVTYLKSQNTYIIKHYKTETLKKST